MVIEVVGVKFVEGTSKSSGKAFKAYIISYVRDGEFAGYLGKQAGEIFINFSFFGGRIPQIGDLLRVSRDGGYVESLEFINDELH